MPAWLAVRVHVPAATIVTVNVEIVHTDVVDEVTVTVSPESLVGLIVNGVAE